MNKEDERKVNEVEQRLDRKDVEPYVGQRVIINEAAPYFNGEKAIIAYIGDGGVSVYLSDSVFDECIPLKYGEYDIL